MFAIEPQELKDVLLLKPKVFSDNRGYFFESFKYSIFEEIGLNLKFVQDNENYLLSGARKCNRLKVQLFSIPTCIFIEYFSVGI